MVAPPPLSCVLDSLLHVGPHPGATQEVSHSPPSGGPQQTSQGKAQSINKGKQLSPMYPTGLQTTVDSWLPVVVMVPVDS